MKIKYYDQILRAFTKYNFIPRDNQITIVDRIIKQYIDNKKRYVVLSSPTGSGKSIIAVVVAQVLSYVDTE